MNLRPKLGQTLANGAIVIACREIVHGYVVLALRLGYSRDEYATWICTNDADTCNGHYYDNIKDATFDYLERR